MAKTIDYLVTELPDPAYPRYQLAAGGDPRRAIWRDWERLARILINFPPGSITVTMKAVFSPMPANGHVQSRLRLYLSATSNRTDLLESFRLLIEQGPLSRFYGFTGCETPGPTTKKLKTSCQVVRRTDNLAPLHGPELNDRIPEFYYQIHPFEPVEDNDLLALDGVLNKAQEPVIIEIILEPADVSSELSAHTGYLARLHSINRTWDQDDFNYDWPSEHLENDPSDSSVRNDMQRIKPLRLYDPLADDVLRAQQRFHDELKKPHFLFSIKIGATTRATAHLLASVYAESAFDDGSYRIIERSGQESRTEDPTGPYAGFHRLPNLATAEEIKGAFRLPVASYASPLCIRKNTDPPQRPVKEKVVIGVDQELATAHGAAIRKKAIELVLALNDFTKHLFICGMSGYGKTTLGNSILIQLRGHGVPFIIFEPVKTEYRLLRTLHGCNDPAAKTLARDLRIYTPGNDSISPLRHNFLQGCKGIGLFEHVGNLLDCLLGSMPMLPMLPAILAEAMERVYEGRDMVTDPPTVSELLTEAKKILLEKGYSPETRSDILAALEVRLGSLTRGSVGQVFQSRFSIPTTRDLIRKPTLIEMDHLSKDYSSLLTMLLLMSIRENLITTPWAGGKPRLAIVIEEAHNLVGRTGPAKVSEEAADPEAFAAEAICKLLVEFRALGVSVIILDQHPSRVAPEVVKATTTQVAFRQTYESDREEIGRAMLFGPLELEEIARLKTGEAYLYTEALHGPRRILTEDLHSRLGFGEPVLREKIVPLIDSDTWFTKGARDRATVELIQLKEAMDAYDYQRLDSISRLQRLLEIHARIESENGDGREARLRALLAEASGLRSEMEANHQAFIRNPYRRFLADANPAGFEDEGTGPFRDALVERFEGVIESGFSQGLKMVDDLISHCRG